MIDTHCHLTDPRLEEQLDSVLHRASAAGVSRMVTIGTDLDDALNCIELCRAIPNVRCAIGIHPNHCGHVPEEDLPRLRHLQSDPTVVALGEMGLDYHHDFAPRDRQKNVFEFQLELAAELKRPVVIHSREATDDTLAILRGFPHVRAVFHCFTGTVEEARKILDAGYLLGFTGAATFKKNDEIRAAVALAPLDRILVETDAPYLSPEPVRSQRTNEPAFVMHVAAVVARVKGVSLEELDRITTTNALSFYQWT
ncbi:MAG TPA: TatD family hydrolase [Tepidisphaeraceae bacterium]|jgi:TatD DNase family protein